MAERGSTAASVSGPGLWLLSLLGRGLGARARIEDGVVRTSGRWPHLREQRWALLAAAAGLGLWVAGAVLNDVWPWLWPLAFGGGAAGAALLWRLDRGRRPMAVAGGAGAWLALCWYWPAAGAVGWLAGTALLAGRLAWSIVRRMDLEANAKLARVLAEWERRIVPSARLTGARVLSGESDRVGLRLHVQLPLGLTLGEVQTSRLEHVLDHVIGGLKPDSVRISRDPEGASRCVVRVQLRTPLARSVEWPAPSELRSIKDPIALGVSESGQPVTICLLPKAGEGLNVFACGIKGSGKSMLLNVLIGSLVYCRDVVIWGVDLKHGMELRPWERCLDRFVSEPEEARELIAAAVRIERARGRELARRGKRAWEPTPEEPELVIVIDELADLEDMSGLFQLARKARAVGIHLILATQRPSKEALGEGSTDLRAQIDVFVGLRISRPEDANIVFGSGMGGRGWQPHMFNGPLYPGNGYFLISSPQHGGPEPDRCYLMTDEMVVAAARPCGEGGRARLDERSERAAGPLSLGLAVDDEELPELAPEERLWAALERAPRDGAAAPELMEETGMSRGWVMERLKHYVQQGRVQRVGHGRYRVAREGEEG